MLVHGKRYSAALYSLIIVFLLYSCSSTKHVPDDRYLLSKVKIETDNKQIDKKELESYIRPKPNKKILFFIRFYLGLYNLSGDKDSRLNGWLQKIGEAPILWDEYEIEKNNERLKLYLKNKGYYYAHVDDSTRFHNKKAKVRYAVETGDPYYIRNINYNFRDTTLRNLVLRDTVNSLLKRGSLFDADILQKERQRVEEYLQTSGYFNFTKDYILYQADSLQYMMRVDLTANFNEYQLNRPDGTYSLPVPHRKYRIRNVYILPDFNQKEALVNYEDYIANLTEEVYNNYRILYTGQLKINPLVVTQSIYIIPGNMFHIDDVRETYKHLSSLRIFKMVNIYFEETEPYTTYYQDDYPLDCYIQLSPSTLQSYTIELEGTNSSGNVGAAGNISYQHRNLFGGGENLHVRLKGAVEFLRKIDSTQIQRLKGVDELFELGIDTRITLPQFLLPIKTENFIRKYNPRTRITFAGNIQKRPDYTRSIINAGFGYTWSTSPYIAHIINPLDINFVKIFNIDSVFRENIQGTYLEHSYEDKLITALNYSFMFNNQDINKLKNYFYLRLNAEQSGNLLSGLYNIVGTPNEDGRFELMKNEFAQYLKGDIDLRYYHIVDDKTSFVYRIFMGMAYPYGNSVAIPFEKQYFTGGANGIRAWPVKNLGPGKYRETESVYPNATADIKLETNFEYRFKLFWILEGALFADAGNIWAIRQEEGRPGSVFHWDTFYHQIAIGTGVGLRMDFSFFIFRIDMGLKIRDPSFSKGERWVILDWQKNVNDLDYPYKYPNFHIAIGYPF
ncbi:MAG: hypothetical protein AMS27_05320 [Bacteroides sp. SM23_62_1]|nr:MAG: hypothetical protein AMS27_05320 [Bacteroides sp. SM23_62_1]